ncbi:hypothetical protein BN903_8 [Halorubrum sp. AJ67]|nr:hypothetical protein BN903_8 [Halorubrum sp. AJ67]
MSALRLPADLYILVTNYTLTDWRFADLAVFSSGDRRSNP